MVFPSCTDQYDVGNRLADSFPVQKLILHVSTTAVKTNLLCYNYNHVNVPTLETGIEWQCSLEIGRWCLHFSFEPNNPTEQKLGYV